MVKVFKGTLVVFLAYVLVILAAKLGHTIGHLIFF